MNESPGRDLEVFDFKEEDAIVSDKRLTFKFNKTPILSDHDSLANDAQVNKDCDKNVASFSCVNVDEVGGISSLEKDCPNSSLKSVDDMFDDKGKNSEFGASKQSSSISHENHSHLNTDIDYYDGPEERDTSGGVSTPETSQIGPSGSPSSNESVDVNSEAGVCSNESSPTSASADIGENGVFNFSLNGCGLNGTDNSDMDDRRTEVVLRPDYIIYQDNYYTGPKLTFSHCGIKINLSTACMKQGAFDLEWALDDLIDIKCQLFQSSGMVIMKIRVISSNANQLDHLSDTSGVEELEIAVVDFNWPLRHQQITSLNVQYLAIWNIALNTDVEGNETKSRGSRCYFPNFEEPFDEVIYPKGDPDAVSLSKRDFDLLQPDTFVNDTIIDFYIQYLKNQIQDEERPRFYFFNSFFFRKLADMDKNPSSASDAKAAFLRVRKWTRKVKLFEKDYIFIPVNFNLHWSLIVICHPGDVVNFNDKELDKSLKVPCILHMDSIKGSHSGLKNLVQSYLWEEWKERHKDTLEEDLSARFSNMRFIPLALPQQENSYDCGLFLLHYLELFLAEAPLNFNPFKVTRFSKFLNVDWFLPAEAYLKRTLIQRLIFEVVENHGVPEISSSDCSDDHQYTENNENRTAIEHPEVNKETTTSLSEKGIEITLLSGSSSLDPQSFNNSGLVLKELFEPGAPAGSVLAQCQSIDQRPSDYQFNDSIFAMEEQSDLGEQFMYLATDPSFHQVDGVTPQTSLPYLPGDCGNETCHRPEISLQVAESSQGNASDDSEDVGVIKNCPPTENTEHFIDILGSSSSNLPMTSVVGICQDSITNCDGNKNGNIGSPCQEIPTVKSNEVSDAVDDKAACDDDGQMIDGMTPNISEEQAAKRRRLMHLQCTSEGIVTESDL